nr:outer membrane beta-barrel protein [Kofleriaceae bacterium]
MMSLLALGGLTSSGVAIAIPDDQPLPSPSEPNVPPPAQPDAPPTTTPMTPTVPTTPAPGSPTTPAVPTTPATPTQPAVPTAVPPTTPGQPVDPNAPVDPNVPAQQPAPTAAAATPAPTSETIIPVTNQYHEYGFYQPVLASSIGVGVTVGGGLFGFTDRAMRESVASDVGGVWDVHASIGTHIPIGLEVGYSGNAANIQSLAGTPNGTLVGTAMEAALRYTIFPHSNWTPFVFAGMGWQRYDVTSQRLAASDTGLKTSDDVADFPMGGGLSFRDVGGFTFDLRGTYRATTGSTLLLDQRTNQFAGLQSWEASAALGYEF